MDNEQPSEAGGRGEVSDSLSEESRRFVEKALKTIDPDAFGDPEPLSLNATYEELDEYFNEVGDYATDILDCFKESSLQGEDCWIEYTCTFRPQTIHYMPRNVKLQ